MKTCTNCKTENPDNATFCRSCGESFSQKKSLGSTIAGILLVIYGYIFIGILIAYMAPPRRYVDYDGYVHWAAKSPLLPFADFTGVSHNSSEEAKGEFYANTSAAFFLSLIACSLLVVCIYFTKNNKRQWVLVSITFLLFFLLLILSDH